MRVPHAQDVPRAATILVALVLTAAACACARKPITPQELVTRMTNAYASCQSYEEEGEVTSVREMPGPRPETTGVVVTNTQSFQLQFRRPASLRIEFALQASPTPTTPTDTPQATDPPRPQLVLASDGQQTCLYSAKANTYWQAESLSNGLARTTPLLHGWDKTVVALLTGTGLGMMQAPTQAVSSVREGNFDRTPCHVLVSHWEGGAFTDEWWIGKQDFLLRQRRRTIGALVGRTPMFVEERHRTIQLNRAIPESAFRVVPPQGARASPDALSLLRDAEWFGGLQAWRAALHPRAMKIVNSLAEEYTGRGNATGNPKIPSYIDCHPDRVVLYPGGVALNWEDLQRPGSAVETLLAKVAAHKTDEYLVIMVRPGSLKFYRAIKNMVARAAVDVESAAVDADFKVNRDAALKALAVGDPAPRPPAAAAGTGAKPASVLPVFEVPGDTTVFKPTPRAVPTNKQPVFFECRHGEVCFVDKTGLDAQVTKRLSALKPEARGGDLAPFLKAIQGEEIGNDCYVVDPKYLLVGIMALDARPNVKGDNLDAVRRSDSRFQKTLAAIDKQSHYVVFLVRDDSFPLFRRARVVADHLDLESGWELLGSDEPIKFGQGGVAVAPK